MTGRTELDAPAGTNSPGRYARSAVAIAADLAAVVVFVVIGRRSHAESDALTGLLHTGWPFVVGALSGWLIARGWRAPDSIRPTGLVVWIACVAIGMALRAVSGQGVAVSFFIVATIALGVLVLGWRAATALAGRRQARRR